MNFANKNAAPDPGSLTDGALDTLDCVFRTMGRESFSLDTDSDVHEFPATCMDVARHIENGSPVPGIQVDEAEAGTRHWSKVRRFFVDRRQKEKAFVSGRLQDYRGVVEHFIVGLKEISAQNDQTELLVTDSFESLEKAIDGGQLPDVQKVLAGVIQDVGAAFDEQKKEYEQQIATLNERMDSLREDLVAAQETMQLDALTNVYNRGAFDMAIQRLMNTRFMLSQPVSVVMIDVDNFKSINDTFGHAAGDSILKSVAECLSRSFIRKNDIIARYGGDEFIVILPDTSGDRSTASIRRFLDGVQKIQLDHSAAGTTDAGDEIEVSCSAGCAEMEDDDTVDSLVARVDEALYKAKEAGRNCFRIN